MAIYAIGDIQGCAEPLHALLARVGFDPGEDRLWLTGDLVNRGPRSLEVLRFVRELGDRATVVLGNHDLHLLAVWYGQAKLKRHDSLQQVLDAPDGEVLIDWLRSLPLIHVDSQLGYAMVHAGIHPRWTLSEAQGYAAEVEAALRVPDPTGYFRELYGNEPHDWDPALTGMDRLRFITNVLTRMRYCAEDGSLLLDYKGAPETRPTGHLPWFQVPGRRREANDPTLVCGHWSTLGFRDEAGILALDTGCLWGGKLTAVRLDGNRERYELPCEACLQPK